MTLPLRFPLILGLVLRQGVKDEHLPPLGALIECREELVDGGHSELHEGGAAAAGLVDFIEGSDSIGNHLRNLFHLFH